MKDFKKLEIWKRAHQLTLEVYSVSSSFPKEEVYGLTSQIRRAAASVPTNIAEGCGRDSDAELVRFSIIAMGSASELEYQLLLVHDLGYLKSDDYTQRESSLTDLKRMLNAFIQTVKKANR